MTTERPVVANNEFKKIFEEILHRTVYRSYEIGSDRSNIKKSAEYANYRVDALIEFLNKNWSKVQFKDE